MAAGERRRHVRPSPALRLVFDLRRDRGRITVGVADYLRDEVVLHRRPQQVLGIEIEEPQSSASCAARCRSSRVASEKNCVMSTCSTGRRAGGAEVRAPVGLVALDAEWPVEELREELVEQATPAAPKVAERIVRRRDLLARAFVP